MAVPDTVGADVTPCLARRPPTMAVSSSARGATGSAQAGSGGVGRGAEAELRSDRLQCRDDVCDVLVQLEAEELRAGVHLVPVHAGSERRLLEFLAHRLGLQP